MRTALLLLALVCLAGGSPGDWCDLGLGLSGSTTPTLAGLGSQIPTGNTKLTIAGGPPGATATLIVSLVRIDAAFKGGTLVPAPDFLVALPLDGAGGIDFIFPWPSGIPLGTNIYWQAWMPDAGAPKGLAATNGLESTAN